MKQKNENEIFYSTSIMIHLLDASKPPEGTGVVVAGSGAAGTIGTAATAAGTGGVGEVREPRASKPDSRRSLWTRAGAKAGARAGAAVGARVGDIRPEEGNRQDCNCDIICWLFSDST